MASDTKSKHPYQDANVHIDDRVEDLLKRMTLEEKAGQMFHNIMVMGPNGTLADANPIFGLESTEKSIQERFMTHFNLLGVIKDARVQAEWFNRVQEAALSTRLGIPITLSSDPRNHFTDNVGTEFSAGSFSQWPEPLGLAALRSPDLVQHFADCARQEYIAVGIRCSLHPQVDLATEPRWARIAAAFGEDSDLTSDLVGAYIRGFQGMKLGPTSVTTMTKHFPGGGPQKDGEDPHFDYGKDQVYPGNNLEYHMKPFRAAIEAGASQIMPYYGRPVGTEYEEVGFGLNKSVITGLLREKLGFTGIVCTDWGLVTDSNILGQAMPARCWGAEHLTEIERVKKILDAGCDQFGGEFCTQHIIKLVQNGQVPESRIDQSVRRLLHEKFTLGLFDTPYVDVEKAISTIGNDEFQRGADDAQRRSFTLLTNKNNVLPLKNVKDKKIYIEGIDAKYVTRRGFQVVTSPELADVALLRLKCPWEPRPGGFERMFHAGSLEFSDAEKQRQAHIYKTVPISIVDIYLDRPAVLPEIAAQASALMANYGSSADALLDVVLGEAQPEGKLPFDLPSSMKAVRESKEDMQYDTKDPAFRFGHGLRYQD